MSHALAPPSRQSVAELVTADLHPGRTAPRAATTDAARLSRKRATDRRSQQASRERTRLRMAALEGRVAELTRTGEDLGRQLSQVTLERDRLRKDCHDLKGQAGLAAELQNEVHAFMGERDHLTALHWHPEPEPSIRRHSLHSGIVRTWDMRPDASTSAGTAQHAADYLPVSARTSSHEVSAHRGATTPRIQSEAVSPSDAAAALPPPPQPPARGPSSLIDGAAVNPAQDVSCSDPGPGAGSGPHPAGLSAALDLEPFSFPPPKDLTSPHYRQAGSPPPIDHDLLDDEFSDHTTADDLPVHIPAERLTGGTSITAPSPQRQRQPHAIDLIPPRHQQTPSPAQLPSAWSPLSSSQVEACEQLPYNLRPVIPSDRILQALVASQRCKAADGASWVELLGPELPCWAWLVNPTSQACVHAVCRAVVDIVKTYSGYSALPERVAAVYTMYTYTTWRIWPQKERFNITPSWMHPRSVQLRVAHPAWMDRVPWPTVREVLVTNQELYRVEEYGVFHSTSVSLNWPYAANTVLITPRGQPAHDGDTVVLLNPAFEEHIRNIRNWTTSSRFTQHYPELAAAINQDVAEVPVHCGA